MIGTKNGSLLKSSQHGFLWDTFLFNPQGDGYFLVKIRITLVSWISLNSIVGLARVDC